MTLPPVRHLVSGIAALLLFGFGANFALAQGQLRVDQTGAALSAAEREEVRELVRAYILDNPEIIPEAVKLLEERQAAAAIAANRKALETPYEGAWAGAEDGDVVLVEFFDYNCSFCRRSYPDVARLLEEDDDLKVVYREFPVLGPASREASMASLSAARQGKHGAFYSRMFDDGRRVDRQKIVDIVRRAGLSERRTAAEMDSAASANEIQTNLQLGRALGLSGTPSYVIGGRILSGAVGYDTLKRAIEEAREKS